MAILRLRHTSFRMQIALVFGAMVLALVIGMSWVLGQMMSNSLRGEAGNALHSVARNAATVLGQGLNERLVMVEGLANATALWKKGLDTPEARDVIQRQQALRHHVAWLGVVDADGTIRQATGDLLKDVNVRARPWFPAGMKEAHVGDVHPAKLLAKLLPLGRDGEPQRFVDFVAPIRIDGQTLGVVSLHGSWDWTHEVIESLLPGNATQQKLQIFIFDAEGKVIYAPEGQNAPLVASAQRLPQLRLEPGHVAGMADWTDGKDYLTAVVKVLPPDARAYLGWQVVARMPATTALAQADAAMKEVRKVGLLAGLAAGLAAWLIAGTLSGPLSAIARSARDVQQGKPGAEIARYDSNEELRSLSDALSAMTRQLLSSNEELEQRVQARTGELEQANQALDRLVRCDPLTQLLNRRGFDDQLKTVLAGARRRGSAVSMLAIDVDHFKRVNDTHGHDIGDQVLKTLATVLKERLRETDVIGRLGGEEFVALLPDTDAAAARIVAGDVVRRVQATLMPGVGSVTISCGVAVWLEAEDASETLKRADLALYRAKSQGRNRVVFEHSGLVSLDAPAQSA